ncbi:uncharacterized protein LOC128199684 [Bicyclus anynana]|uniref:Uncharacterized protein LOC128199684 n=1 Tax=Bicyclus anynana TaxID=110368 RepID=A0ABM3M3X8_BICAN|nr:uncharacterized protein LOC128199684 [Bicyclus anynana]
MPSDSDGIENDSGGKRKPPRRQNEESDQSENFYKPYVKSKYKRVFPEAGGIGEYTVYLESRKEDDKIGNTNPLILTGLFKNEIKGVTNIRRINASKVEVVFARAINANDFLKNDNFLEKYNYKAFIPAKAVETIGVLRFIPTSISNEELFKKLSSKYEIVAVRRFCKKVNGQIKAFSSVSVTFLSTNLPDYVHLDLFQYKVYEYIAPLLQCYKCFKFNHGARFCKSAQFCSICAEEHRYTDCSENAVLKCINCSGPHLAISKDCPIKKQKMEDKFNKTSYAKVLQTQQTPNIFNNYSTNFPSFPSKTPTVPINTDQSHSHPGKTTKDNPKMGKNKTDTSQIKNTEQLIEQILKNDNVLNGLIGALVEIGNSNLKLTTSIIKDILTTNLKKYNKNG